MAEGFLSLSSRDRTEALLVAASNSGRPVHILEKDAWVVWALHSLFDSGFGNQLVFKGGTSLSKVYKAIERFSEDIDVTYDIRAIAQEWVKDSGDEPVPETRSQGKRWTDTIRARLPKWLAGTVIPHIEKRITSQKLEAKARLEENCIHIEYAHSTEGYDYVSPRVKIEFGARSSGEPVESRQIVCDAAEFLPTLTFPIPVVRVMRVERTAWEKMTAIHVFCEQENIKDRLSRHWYDIAKLDVSGYIDAALKDRDIARRVADHTPSLSRSGGLFRSFMTWGRSLVTAYRTFLVTVDMDAK